MEWVTGSDKTQAREDDVGTIANQNSNTKRYSTSTLDSQGSESPSYRMLDDSLDQGAFLYYQASENAHYLIKPSKFSMWVGPTDLAGSATGTMFHEYTSLWLEDESHLPSSLAA